MWELALRQTLIDWLRFNSDLSTRVNAIEEEAPLRTSEPWLGIVASASTDWSTKTEAGCEVRVALELQVRGDLLNTGQDLLADIVDLIATIPAQQDGWRIVSNRFLRGRVEQRPDNKRAALLEFRFRLIES